MVVVRDFHETMSGGPTTGRRAYLRPNEFAKEFKGVKLQTGLDKSNGFNNFKGVRFSPDVDHQHLVQQSKKIFKIKECHVCKKPITDSDEIVALGKSWHSGHFVCTHCKIQLNPSDFCDMKNMPYCEYDFNLLFREKCFQCTKPIVEQPIKLLGKTLHQMCFKCSECSKQLTTNDYYERGGKLFCEDDWHRLFSPKCFTCKEPVKSDGDLIRAIGRSYHNYGCFCCIDCRKQLNPNNFRAVDGKLYCEEHFHWNFSPRCTSCREPIKGAPVIALDQQFHEGCFKCTHCKDILTNRNFIERDGQAYCRPCDLSLFAPKCFSCRGPIEGESVKALNVIWHPGCFTCKDCDFVLTENTFFEVEGEGYCPQHYHSRTCKDCVKIRRAQDQYFLHHVGEPKNTLSPLRRAASHSSLYFQDYAFQEIRPNSAMF